MIWRLGGVPMKQFFCQPFDRPPEDEEKQGDDNRYSEQPPVTESADDAEHRANPDRRGGREPRDMPHRVAQNNASTEKSNASQNALHDARDRIRVGRTIQRPKRKKNSYRRAKTNQRVRPQSRRFAVQLPIQTEDRPKEQRGPEAQHGLFISSQHDESIEPEVCGEMQAYCASGLPWSSAASY